MGHRSRNWMITIFTENTEMVSTMSKLERIKYFTGQFEICPTTNKKHFQGYIEMKNPIGLSGLKKYLNNDQIHLEERKGNQKQAIAYVTKAETSTGERIEEGKKGEQGRRTDLERAIEMIKEKKKINEIIDEIPHMIRYDKHLERYREREVEPRNFQTEVYTLIGEPGTGKTRYVYENETDIYTVPEASSGTQYFNGYTGQEAVLIDDFNGNIRYHLLLQLLDRYPMLVNTKGGVVNWRPKRVYITSNKAVDEWYAQDCKALKRRITRSIDILSNTQVEAQKSAVILAPTLNEAWDALSFDCFL